MRLRTLVASNHRIFRGDVARFVELLDPCIEVVGQAATAGEVLVAIRELNPDLALLDLGLLAGNTLHLVTRIRRAPCTALVVVIGNQPAAEYRDAAIAAGALDYVDVLDLATALPAALEGVPQVITCHQRIQQTAAWREPEHMLPPVVQLREAREFRGTLGTLQHRLRTVPTGPKHGPYTTWQYVHLGLGTVLGQVILTLHQTPDVEVARYLLLVLFLAGITVLEARQFMRARRAAVVAGYR